MKNQSNSKKTTIIAVIAFIVLAIVYFYFSGGTTPESVNTIEVQSVNAVGSRVLSLLNQIQSLQIKSDLFKSTAYQTLVDYSVEIPELPVGRPNPFAPLPGVSNNPINP